MELLIEVGLHTLLCIITCSVWHNLANKCGK